MSYKISFQIDNRIAQTIVPDDVKLLYVDQLISPKDAKELSVLITIPKDNSPKGKMQNNMILPCSVEHIENTAETDLINPCALGSIDKVPEAMLVVFVNAADEHDTDDTKNTRLYFAVLTECDK